MKRFLFVAISILSLSSCMIRTEKNPHTITVTGTGAVAVENKEATLVLSVISRNDDVIKASEENAEKMTQVMKAMTDAGVGNDSIHTSDYSIRQEEIDRQNSRKPSVQYIVSNRLQVTVKDISKTGVIIDAAIKAGANQMNSLNYSAGDTKDAEKQARILAVRDADQKAGILSSTSGLTLGKIMNIFEHEGSYGYVRNSYALESIKAATPISGGSSTVSVTVDVTYELQK